MAKYTDEKNILMLISLLKKHHIRKVIASPGAMNISFIGSIQNDDFFEIYSCVDERSASYMACGLAQESGEPVILTCTGATASRNYVPGLTEAYYNKLPVLAITSAQHLGKIGHNIPQVVDRRSPFNDIVRLSVQLPSVSSKEDEWACNTSINEALLELRHNGGGPVHINLVTTYSTTFNVSSLPDERKINRIRWKDDFPSLVHKKIGIFIGNHKIMSKELESSIEKFCETYNAVVLCDMTSNYFGNYRVKGNIVCDQDCYQSPVNDFDIIIHLGNISGSYMRFRTKEVYRVSEDGKLRDTYYKLTNLFEMDELDFFLKYNSMHQAKKDVSFYQDWKKETADIISQYQDDEVPFSNIWISNHFLSRLPDSSKLHLGILNSLRSCNYVNSDKKIYAMSNTGGFGIDGCLSTVIGASLYNRRENYYCIVGDLAFSYDLNSLGNRNVANNLRILLINNGCGTEFHNYNHAAQSVGKDLSKFIAADGHNGNQSTELVKNYTENLGLQYLSASNKEEFLENLEIFLKEDNDKSILFEVFTDPDDESNALRIMRNLKRSSKDVAKANLKKVAKKILRK